MGAKKLGVAPGYDREEAYFYEKEREQIVNMRRKVVFGRPQLKLIKGGLSDGEPKVQNKKS